MTRAAAPRATVLPPAAHAVLAAVDTGRPADVPAPLAELGDAGRRTLLEVLGQRRRAFHEQPGDRRPHLSALRLAGAGCHRGPAGCAQWLMASDLRRHRFNPADLAAVLAPRGPRWAGELIERLGDHPGLLLPDYRMIEALQRETGAPVPLGEPFVRMWALAVTERTRHVPRRRTRTGLAPVTRLDVLREDPYTPLLAPRFFEIDRMGGELGGLPAGATPEEIRDPRQWPGALAALAREGLLDRRALLEGCCSVLVRGGRADDPGFFLALLTALEPTDQELEFRTGDWAVLAADAPSAVAAWAQGTLRRLWEADRLSAATLAQLSPAVLFRTEKKVVRAQLSLLDRALRQRPEQAGLLLPAVAEAFAHPDITLQERAVRLLARHARRLPGAAGQERARQRLTEAAAGLTPMLRARAAELLGEPELLPDPRPAAPAGTAEALPPYRGQEPLGAPPAEPATLAAEVAAMLAETASARRPAAGSQPALDFERALDGLIRLAHRDRTALAGALQPLAGHHPVLRDAKVLREDTCRLGVVVAAVLGTLGPADALGDGGAAVRCAADRFRAALDARLREAAHRIVTGDPLPLLLATPGSRDGLLAPGELIRRLAEYARLGVRPAAADFDQALLRLRHPGPEERAGLAARAGAAGLPEGDRLAACLAAGPPRPPSPSPHSGDHPVPPPPVIPGRQGHPAMAGLAVPGQVRTPEFRALAEPFPAVPGWCPGSHPAGHWLLAVPGQREAVAGQLGALLVGENAADWGRSPEDLPLLAEAPGPAGAAVHDCLARGLGSAGDAHRAAAVDALLTLAAQRRLDAGLMARSLARLLRPEAALAHRPVRTAAALAMAAESGAHRTVWAVLAELLPGLLAEARPPRVLGDLLAVAADCAERIRPGTEPAGLAEYAARRGGSRARTEARRLAAALAAR
ncbi:DUF6493 family protein [Streptomyces aidingensis]|uniref:DUF7824 domain-containing protein n=1 Tax=Streptomyces aidingensis TaxID=910347 RepID=A0A1I1HD47_9ACTN|nr:DUF6493 family protein [Streptomyces aidingensis]SFC19908.1 hypothetical protein SAMN05421773_102284 [Streptomyces aidingensis]